MLITGHVVAWPGRIIQDCSPSQKVLPTLVVVRPSEHGVQASASAVDREAELYVPVGQGWGAPPPGAKKPADTAGIQ